MKHTYCVIMCGGVGSRFWPYSREKKPKQFLDFFGTGKSLLQSTADRAIQLVGPDNIVVMTNAAYATLVRQQLPMIKDSNILCEPARRNTAPCICWSAFHIKALDPEASIITLPSDHLILKENAFLQALREGDVFVRSHEALLTLGIKPSGPNTGYGYIQQGAPVNDWEGIRKVKSFTEKPELPMAEFFVKSGEFFWNAGIFLWKADTILKAFSQCDAPTFSLFEAGNNLYATPKEMHYIEQAYPKAPSNSVDYAVMEKASNVYVKTVDIGWSDLGTWKALHELSPRTREGNVTQGCKALVSGCSNSVFVLKDDKIVIAEGLDGYVVAESDNALLIYPIDKEQKVKQVVNDVKLHFGEKYI